MMPDITSVKLQKIRREFDDLQSLFQKYLPKVDPDLIYDLLTRLRENSSVAPTYTLEVYTKKGVDSAEMVDFIYKTTGAMATVYDDGTHYVTNQKLTLEMLNCLSDLKGVVEVTGAATTAGCWFSDSVKREGI